MNTKARRIEAVMVLALVSLAPGRAAFGTTVERETVQPLTVSLSLEPLVMDYELPGHPLRTGGGHLGMLTQAALVWRHGDHVRVDVGGKARVPFAVNFEEELGALPLLSLTLRAPEHHLLMRFGSLDTRHGYHPAIVDARRLSYGNPIEETYNQSIPEAAHRDFGGAPRMPGEHGVQLIADSRLGRIEGFIDWQLLETESNREKFAFGLIGALELDWVLLSVQFRLVHYGGQRFTRMDPLRFHQLDPVRQPTSAALMAVLRPFSIGVVDLELPLAGVGGTVIQTPGALPSWHMGVEAGIEFAFLKAIRAGYRLWLPRGGSARFVSEDGDPVYAQGRSHKIVLGLTQSYGPVEVGGSLDLVFPVGTNKVQYLTFTSARFDFDLPIATETAQ